MKGGVDVLLEILRRNIFAAKKTHDIAAGHVFRQRLGLQKEIGGALQKYSLTGNLPRLFLDPSDLHTALCGVRMCGDFLHHFAQPGLSGERGAFPKYRLILLQNSQFPLVLTGLTLQQCVPDTDCGH